MDSSNKGKQKIVGVSINDSKRNDANPNAISQAILDLEKARKAKEDLAIQLEKLELEATTDEMKRKIAFLHANMNTNASSSIPVASGPMPQNQLVGHVPNIQASISKQMVQGPVQSVNPIVPLTGNLAGIIVYYNTEGGGAQASQNFQRRLVHLDRYRPLFFDGIPSQPNVIPNKVRDKIPKFTGNNVITCEEHLKSFIDKINDCEIENEDVFMKLFVQSMVEDARDWYRGLPENSITSWDEFIRNFKEQYVEHVNSSYMLNEFNNIKKHANESMS